MPHASVHDVSPCVSTARTPLHRASHSYPRYAGATCRARRRMTYRHAPRPHARPHRAPRSYPRYAGATSASWPAVARQLQARKRWWPAGFGTRRVRKSAGHAEPPQSVIPRTVTPGAVRAVAESRPQVWMHGHLREAQGRGRMPWALRTSVLSVWRATVRDDAGEVCRRPLVICVCGCGLAACMRGWDGDERGATPSRRRACHREP